MAVFCTRRVARVAMDERGTGVGIEGRVGALELRGERVAERLARTRSRIFASLASARSKMTSRCAKPRSAGSTAVGGACLPVATRVATASASSPGNARRPVSAS